MPVVFATQRNRVDGRPLNMPAANFLVAVQPIVPKIAAHAKSQAAKASISETQLRGLRDLPGLHTE